MRRHSMMILLEEHREALDAFFDGSTLVEDVVDGATDGHRHLVALVDLIDTLSSVVTFSDHIHLHLSGTDTVALADHVPEGAIATIA